MTKTFNTFIGQLLSMLLLVGAFTPAHTHHSYAIFDNSKVVPVTGTIVKVEWVNPHIWLHVQIVDANGVANAWRLECRSISELARQGLRSTDFETGGKITADIWLARDGAHLGTVVSGTAVSGKRFGRIMPPSPTTGGPI